MEKKKSKKILKIILIIIAIVIAILIIHIIRNFIIVSNLQDKVKEYTDSTNYHIKIVGQQENGINTIVNYYKKDNKQVIFLERIDNEKTIKMSTYNNGERTDMFVETPDSKVATLDSATLMGIQIYDYLQTENTWQTILSSVISQIRSTKFNERNCYAVSNFSSNYLWLQKGKSVIYIDKDTGLMIGDNNDNLVSEREYEFNNVDDSIFIEPDISQYTLKSK